MIEYADREFYEKMFHGKVIPENAFSGMVLYFRSNCGCFYCISSKYRRMGASHGDLE